MPVGRHVPARFRGGTGTGQSDRFSGFVPKRAAGEDEGHRLVTNDFQTSLIRPQSVSGSSGCINA